MLNIAYAVVGAVFMVGMALFGDRMEDDTVLLQMAALQLGDIEKFPFLDPPDRRSVRDGVALLQELGAFDGQGAITDLGRRLARLPVDPRLGRMILQAETEGCVREMLVLAAALSPTLTV